MKVIGHRVPSPKVRPRHWKLAKNPKVRPRHRKEAKRLDIRWSSKNDATYVEMDQNLWRNLPDDLIDQIAASLPMPSIFRFRAVCERFNSNLSLKSLRDTYEDARKHPHFVLLVEGAFGMSSLTYSLDFHKWYKVPFRGLDFNSDFDIVVASSGGLICLKHWKNSSLVVFNPITCSMRELPPLRSDSNAVLNHVEEGMSMEAGMLTDANGKDYKIVVWREGRRPVTEVYASKTNDWTLKSSVQMSGTFLPHSGVVCGDFFYILESDTFEDVFRLLAYNIEDDSWHQLQTLMPTDIHNAYLLNHRGTLMLVCGIGRGVVTKGIFVWKLDVTRTTWMPILSMPNEIFTSLTENLPSCCDTFHCAAQGDHICFIATQHFRAVIYDFSRNTWEWSPHFPTCDYHQIVGVQLQLNATV